MTTVNKKTITFCVLASFVCMLLSLPPVRAEASQEVNAARGGLAWVSSTYPSESFSPENVIDGDPATGWASAYYAGYNFWAVDLGYEYDISRICFYGRAGDEGERTGFRIEGADNRGFAGAAVLYERAPGDPPYEPEAAQEVAVGGRYRFLRVIKNDAVDTHLTLFEFEAWTEERITERCTGKTAKAASSAGGTSAGMANDGDGDTIWQSAEHGGLSAWQADMGDDAAGYDIEQILLTAESTPGDPLCNRRFRILLSDSEDFADSIVVYEQDDLVAAGEISVDLSAGTQRQRYIRVEKTISGERLALSEVKVLARPYLGENAAEGKYAYANTVHSYTPAYHPGAAADGNRNTFWCSDECDPPQEPAMLTVDLGAVYSLSGLSFESKTVWGWCDDFTVLTADNRNFTGAQTVYVQPAGEPLAGAKVLYFDERVPARYIRIQANQPGSMLGAAEVRAFTQDALLPGARHPGFVLSAEDQTPVFEVPYSGALAFRAELKNLSDAELNGVLYFVRKEDGILKGVEAFPFTIPAATEKYSLLQELTAKQAGVYSCYAWTEGTQQPLCERVEIVRFR